MDEMRGAATATVAGEASAGRRAVAQSGVRVDRAVSELRRGRLVRLSSGAEELLVGAVEALQPAAWDELADTAAGRDGQRPSVTLTAERAQASGWLRATAAVLADGAVATLNPIGIAGSEPASVAPITLRLPESFDPALLGDLAGIGVHGREGGAAASGAPEVARWTGLGKEAAYLMVTRGEAGIDAWPPERTAPIREAEEIESARLVGVDTEGCSPGLARPTGEALESPA